MDLKKNFRRVKTLQSPFRWPPLHPRSSVVVDVPTCFGLAMRASFGPTSGSVN